MTVKDSIKFAVGLLFYGGVVVVAYFYVSPILFFFIGGVIVGWHVFQAFKEWFSLNQPVPGGQYAAGVEPMPEGHLFTTHHSPFTLHQTMPQGHLFTTHHSPFTTHQPLPYFFPRIVKNEGREEC